MGKYDKVAKEAAEKTDAELAPYLHNLTALSDEAIGKLIPKDDQEKVRDLIHAVRKATAQNEKIAAYAKFAKIAGAAAIKAVKKYATGI